MLASIINNLRLLRSSMEKLYLYYDLPSGKHTKSYWKWSFIVDLPSYKMVDLSVLCMFTRGYDILWHHSVTPQNRKTSPRPSSWQQPISTTAWKIGARWCRKSSVASGKTYTKLRKDPPFYSWVNPLEIDWAIFNSFLYVYQRVGWFIKPVNHKPTYINLYENLCSTSTLLWLKSNLHHYDCNSKPTWIYMLSSSKFYIYTLL